MSLMHVIESPRPPHDRLRRRVPLPSAEILYAALAKMAPLAMLMLPP